MANSRQVFPYGTDGVEETEGERKERSRNNKASCFKSLICAKAQAKKRTLPVQPTHSETGHFLCSLPTPKMDTSCAAYPLRNQTLPVQPTHSETGHLLCSLPTPKLDTSCAAYSLRNRTLSVQPTHSETGPVLSSPPTPKLDTS
jgi:hypothetical protein